jgi:hypothetical protein
MSHLIKKKSKLCTILFLQEKHFALDKINEIQNTMCWDISHRRSKNNTNN